MCLTLFGCTKQKEVEDKGMKEEHLILSIDGTKLDVAWENNDSVKALMEIVKTKGTLHVSSENYGGFEQVGRLPESIVRKDRQMTTQAGDIVLYAGNSIVLFYGSNAWSYTKLGHIENLSHEELKEILDVDQISIQLSISVG